tara:strand:+ start:90 stop:191 length:102 start_codon:yes stop_codon:yes gene_type:complete
MNSVVNPKLRKKANQDGKEKSAVCISGDHSVHA